MTAAFETMLADNAFRLGGSLDKPGDLIGLVRWLMDCQVNGRLSVATDTWSGDLFFDDGRILAATRLSECGVTALRSILEDSLPKRFSLHSWALLEGVAALAADNAEKCLDEVDAVHRSAGQQHAETQPAPRTAETEENILLSSLMDQVLGRDGWPVDALEVTALLESLGVTDQVAMQRYRSSDVFTLGEEVHRGLRARAEREQRP